MTAGQYVKWAEELRNQNLISKESAEMLSRFARSRYFTMDDRERAVIMVKKGWKSCPCKEMFPPDGTLEIFEEVPV